MAKVNDHNYLKLLNETTAVLSSIRDHLARNRSENRAEIAGISAAIKQIQSVLDTRRRKTIQARFQKEKEDAEVQAKNWQ